MNLIFLWKNKTNVELCTKVKLMVVTISMPKYNLQEKYLCEFAQVISQFTHANKYFLFNSEHLLAALPLITETFKGRQGCSAY